jgi:hypothetical protein
VNIQQLRHALKVKWLIYYQQNRPWLTKIRIWGTFDGKRRPCSSFILAAVTNLEPKLIEVLPFVAQLNSDPDRIIAALGLNFNPDEELKALKAPTKLQNPASNGVVSPTPTAYQNSNGNGNGNGVAQPTSTIAPLTDKPEDRVLPRSPVSNLPTWVDESCKGVGRNPTQV